MKPNGVAPGPNSTIAPAPETGGTPPSATFSAPSGSSTTQSATSLDVTWTESDGDGSGIATRSLQRQTADVETPGSCSGVTWADDGAADTNVSARTVGGLATDYADNFARTVSANSWGTADSGGGYTLAGTSHGTFSVDGSSGNVAIDTSNYRAAGALLLTSITDSDIRAKVKLDKVPTGGAVTAVVGTRTVSASNGGYYAQAVFQTSGLIYGNFVRLANSNGAQTAITTAANSSLATYTANRWVNVRFSATGTSPTTLSMKVWYDGTAEPGSWTFTTTDSNADQQQAGSLVVGAVSGTSVSNLPVTVAFDYMSASGGSDAGRCYRWKETLTNVTGNSATTSSGTLLVDSSLLTASFVAPPAGTTIQSSSTADVSWSENDGGSGIASRSLQRQSASVVTAGTCAGVSWSNEGSADTSASPLTVGGLTSDYRDNFTRTVSANSWGTAEVGGSYSLIGTANGTFSADGAQGNLAMAASNYRSVAALLSSSLSTSDVRTKVRLDKLPEGGATALVVGARVVSAQNGGYYAQATVQTTGLVFGNFVRLANSNGAQTAITSSADSGLDAYSADRWLNMRFSASGTSPTTLGLKLWYEGTPEPDDWTFTTTDSNGDQQQAGSIALGATTGTSVSNLNITAQFDYLSASDGSDTARCYRWVQNVTNGASASATATSGALLVDNSAPAAIYPNGGGETSSRTLTWSVPTIQNAYQANVATDSAFTQNLTDSGTVTSSSVAYLVPGTSLTDGTTYYWRVRVKETSGGSLGGWSTTASFVYHQGATLGTPSQDSFESFGLGNGDTAAVNVSTGNFVLSHPIVSLPTVGGAFALGLTYNSQVTANAGTGAGWRLNAMRRLAELGNGDVVLTAGDGSVHTFTKISTVSNVTTYNRPTTVYATLRKDTGATLEWTLTYRDQSVDSFDATGSEGLLAKQSDRFGNAVTFTYYSSSNRIKDATDAASRVVDFAWDTGVSPARLTTMTDWAYLSGGVVQATSTGSRRQYRLFYDSNGHLIGWSNPLNTSGSCPTQASNLTCLTYNGDSLVASVTKRMTQAIISSGAISTTVRDLTSQISYIGNEVSEFQDAQQVYDPNPGTSFTRIGDKQLQVVVQGSATTTTTYGYPSSTDTLGRVESVWRRLGSTQIERRTTWNATFPIEPASITDNYGAQLSTPARTVSYTYLAGSMGLASRLTEPLTLSKKRLTDYIYNANNDVTQTTVYQKGSSTQTLTRYCYASSGCSTSGTQLTMRAVIENYKDGTKGGTNGNEEDVTTEYLYDTPGELTRETRYNYDASGTLLDSRAIGYSYDSYGNQTAVISNYVNGTVSSSGDDVTPNSTTNARTDLTTAFTYDTGGNQISAADPRRAIALAQSISLNADDYVSRVENDGVNEPTKSAVARDPADTSAPRATTFDYDELGELRQTTDFGGLVTATQYDRALRPNQRFEDVDGSGSAAAKVTSFVSFDRGGRLVVTKNDAQVSDSSLGYTKLSYNELGHVEDEIEAYGTSSASTTNFIYDGLDRQSSRTIGYGSGTAQTTTMTYDLGGRAKSIDDEFTCSVSIFDYRDLAVTTTAGVDAGCASGADQRKITHVYDGLGRLTRSEVLDGSDSGDRTFDVTLDSAGRQLTTATRTSGTTSTTTFTTNPIDQLASEVRADGSTAKTNYDAAGNATDRCYWKAGITVGACYEVGHGGWTNPPTQVTSSTYDGRNNRTTQSDSTSGATSTYDPDNSYAIKAFYVPTGTGREHQSLYSYDGRHRLISITSQLCVISSAHACSSTTATGSNSYNYDDNDNRTTVNESNGASSADLRYCYDARNQLQYRNTGAACSSSAKDESYTYDDAGNRLTAPGQTFTYNGSGQLTGCTTGCSTVAHDSAGNVTQLGAWTYEYDSEARLVRACKSTSCAGSIDKVDFTYDGEGHRTKIVETTSSGTVTSYSFQYQGNSIVQDSVGGAVYREYVVDDSGQVVKFCDPSCVTPTTTYLVTWNGHGDALATYRINSGGTLTLVNSYSYSTWGVPTTTVASGFADLGFRFLYLGRYDVQWDNAFGLSLYYMHARHYSPDSGRFLQPDHPRFESNLYVYAGNSPITRSDPFGNVQTDGGDSAGSLCSGAQKTPPEWGCVVSRERRVVTLAEQTSDRVFAVLVSTIIIYASLQTLGLGDKVIRGLAVSVGLGTAIFDLNVDVQVGDVIFVSVYKNWQTKDIVSTMIQYRGSQMHEAVTFLFPYCASLDAYAKLIRTGRIDPQAPYFAPCPRMRILSVWP